MATYDITGHALLSPHAKKLAAADAAAFDVLVTMAEARLKLASTSFTGDQAATAQAALARQVNFQLLQTPESQLLKSQREGRLSRSYRADAPQVDAVAAELVGSLGISLEGDWATVRSLR